MGKQSGYGDLIQLARLLTNQLNTVQPLYTLHQSTKQLSPSPLLLSAVLIVMGRVKSTVYAGTFPKCLPSETLQAKKVVLTVCSSKGNSRKSIVICGQAQWLRVPICCQPSGKYTDRSAGILLLNSSRLQGFLEVRGAEVWLLQPYADPQPLS